MAPGVLLEPYMGQGGQGVTETPIVLKGLNNLCLSRYGNNSKTFSNFFFTLLLFFVVYNLFLSGINSKADAWHMLQP